MISVHDHHLSWWPTPNHGVLLPRLHRAVICCFYVHAMDCVYRALGTVIDATKPRGAVHGREWAQQNGSKCAVLHIDSMLAMDGGAILNKLSAAAIYSLIQYIIPLGSIVGT